MKAIFRYKYLLLVFLLILVGYYFNKNYIVSNEENDSTAIEKSNVSNLKSIAESGELVLNNTEIYNVKLVQTKYIQPLTPSDPNFNMFYSGYYGEFSLIIEDSNYNIKDQINVNQWFNNNYIGFIDTFELCYDDYNFDNNPDVVLGILSENGTESKYIIFSITNELKFSVIPVEETYVYCAGTDNSTNFQFSDNENEILVTVYDQIQKRYVTQVYHWNGKEYLIKESSGELL
jgi:hypothetical protein